MTPSVSLSRRVFLSSIRHRTSRTLQRSSILESVRLNASAAALQPSHVFPTPSPTGQSSPNHQRHERSQVAAGSPSVRPTERRRRRWQAPAESEYYFSSHFTSPVVKSLFRHLIVYKLNSLNHCIRCGGRGMAPLTTKH
jgi:hypothetical protein